MGTPPGLQPGDASRCPPPPASPPSSSSLPVPLRESRRPSDALGNSQLRVPHSAPRGKTRRRAGSRRGLHGGSRPRQTHAQRRARLLRRRPPAAKGHEHAPHSVARASATRLRAGRVGVRASSVAPHRRPPRPVPARARQRAPPLSSAGARAWIANPAASSLAIAMRPRRSHRRPSVCGLRFVHARCGAGLCGRAIGRPRRLRARRCSARELRPLSHRAASRPQRQAPRPPPGTVQVRVGISAARDDRRSRQRERRPARAKRERSAPRTLVVGDGQRGRAGRAAGEGRDGRGGRSRGAESGAARRRGGRGAEKTR